MSGWLLSFTLSWDDVVISQFVAGPGSTTLPMVIFSKVRLGVSPDVNALATLMVLVVVGVVALGAATCSVASGGWRARCAWRRAAEAGWLMAETILLGLDVGGSSIKAGLVDIGRGACTTPLHSVPTPAPSTPEAVLQACARIDRELRGAGTVGLAFPAVVRGRRRAYRGQCGQVMDRLAGGERLSQLIRPPVIFLNDADAAGVAEMSTGGAGVDMRGVVMLLTLAPASARRCSSMGSWCPTPSSEHLEFHGRDAELTGLGARVRTEERLDWPSWCARVNDYLARLHALFWPDLFILGGSISEDFDQFGRCWKVATPIRRAAHGAQAGVGRSSVCGCPAAPALTRLG